MVGESKLSIFLFLIALMGGAAALLGVEDKCLRGTIVLEGVVTDGAGSALHGTAPSQSSFVVKAARVLPPADDAVVRIETGELVTVFGATQPPIDGQKVRVYALGGRLSENVALREVCRENLPITSAASSTDALDALASRRGALQMDDLRKEIDKADVACFGRVTAVLPPPAPGSVSEHDPRWQIAVVDLSGCARNAASIHGFRLRFPRSNYIGFSDVRKPSVGEARFFLIRKIEAQCDRQFEAEKCVDGELIGSLSIGKAHAAGYDNTEEQP